MLVKQWLKTLTTPRPHPQTGDLIRFSERLTWVAMGVYRRWTVFFLLQALTILWWLYPGWFPGGLFGWNLVWSDLAIVVEMMVGIAFLGQSMRDARVLRSEMAELKQMHNELRELVIRLHANPSPLRGHPQRSIYGEGPWVPD